MASAAALIERYESALSVVRALSPDVLSLRQLDDADALRLNQLHAQLSRAIGSAGAAIAGDLAYRSRAELGGDGLARKTGHRTVENLLSLTTGASKTDVVNLVRAGALLTELADDDAIESDATDTAATDTGATDTVSGTPKTTARTWLRSAAEAVGAGHITAAQSQAIERGLEQPNSAITVTQLSQAADELVAAAVAGMTPERLYRHARDLRAELDLTGVQAREDELRALRSLTHRPLADGGGLATWRMDVETYALFVDAYDRMTSPKRGGVRFVDKGRASTAKSIEKDERDHNKRLASDGMLKLMLAGSSIDESVMIGARAPIIRVTVAADALESGIGLGRIDGQSQPVSIDTVSRLMKTGRVIRVRFDDTGRYTGPDEGRFAKNRRYNAMQREILAAKFGGCMDPDCDRPPSWCEAHHIRQVKRDGGPTTIVNATLLCKFHHLRYHNDGYEILAAPDGTYWKIPPKSVDPAQTPIRMPLKTRNLADLASARRHAGARRRE